MLTEIQFIAIAVDSSASSWYIVFEYRLNNIDLSGRKHSSLISATCPRKAHIVKIFVYFFSSSVFWIFKHALNLEILYWLKLTCKRKGNRKSWKKVQFQNQNGYIWKRVFWNIRYYNQSIFLLFHRPHFNVYTVLESVWEIF